MKRTKKILSALCAVCVSLSTTLPVLAADVGVFYIPPYNENIVYGLNDSGTLDDGTEYWVIKMTPEEVVRQQMLRSYDWSGKIGVPIANHSGTNGATVGYSFTVYSDPYVVVTVGNLPSNMPSVNLAFYYDNGSNSDWTPNVEANSMVVLKLKYPSNSGKVKVSTQEGNSKTAAFALYTSATNPADDDIEV